MAASRSIPLQTLYGAPLSSFVAERQRLAAELRAAGDANAAKQVAKLRRPTVSAWTVNQLYWQARGPFDALLAAAARIRRGDLKATTAYRDALGDLRSRAVVLLRDAGHAATGGTLIRVTGTLTGVAAAGGFDPDPPGALTTDREPPGFDALDASGSTREPGAIRSERAAIARTAVAKRERLAAARAEQQEQADVRARQAERRRLETALAKANAEVRKRERAVSLLEKKLRAAEKAVADGRETVRGLEQELETTS